MVCQRRNVLFRLALTCKPWSEFNRLTLYAMDYSVREEAKRSQISSSCFPPKVLSKLANLSRPGDCPQTVSTNTNTNTHTHTQSPSLLCSPGLVASPQVVDVDDESSFILADHVPDFALVNPLVLLQRTGRGMAVYSCKVLDNDFTGLKKKDAPAHG